MVAIATVLPILFAVAPFSSKRGTAFVPQRSYRLPHRVRDRDRDRDRKTIINYRHDDVRRDDLLIPQSVLQYPLPPLTYDKSPGINQKKHRKIRQFLKAGTLDIPRISHSIVGSSSILVGLHHMIEVLIISSFADAECQISSILCTGFIHTLAGLLGIRRLNFKNAKEAARNAMFWPAPIQSFWLASVSLTEWGQGSGALISMSGYPFAFFTALNVLLTVWQLSEVLRKTGHPSRTKDVIWFQKSAHNALLVEFSYLFWMQIQMGTVLFIACSGRIGDFSIFMDSFPKMQYLLSNLALNTAFFNNLAIFVATLLRYKLVSKPKNYNTIVFSLPLLSSVYIVWKVLSSFFLSYDGAMSSSFLALIFEHNR